MTNFKGKKLLTTELLQLFINELRKNTFDEFIKRHTKNSVTKKSLIKKIKEKEKRNIEDFGEIIFDTIFTEEEIKDGDAFNKLIDECFSNEEEKEYFKNNTTEIKFLDVLIFEFLVYDEDYFITCLAGFNKDNETIFYGLEISDYKGKILMENKLISLLERI